MFNGLLLLFYTEHDNLSMQSSRVHSYNNANHAIKTRNLARQDCKSHVRQSLIFYCLRKREREKERTNLHNNRVTFSVGFSARRSISYYCPFHPSVLDSRGSPFHHAFLWSLVLLLPLSGRSPQDIPNPI